MAKFDLSSRGALSLFGAIAKPDFMWRIILASTVVLLILSGGAAWLAHGWATTAIEPTGVLKQTRSVTKEEIRTVIDLYKEKQLHFEALQVRRPAAPMLGKLKSEVTSTSTKQVDANNAAPGVL